jgi:hypothetical protein
MLPQRLIEEFWHNVQGILQDAHGRHSDLSQRAVRKYREVVEPKAGQMIYHSDADKVAFTINAALENGYLFRGFGRDLPKPKTYATKGPGRRKTKKRISGK